MKYEWHVQNCDWFNKWSAMPKLELLINRPRCPATERIAFRRNHWPKLNCLRFGHFIRTLRGVIFLSIFSMNMSALTRKQQKEQERSEDDAILKNSCMCNEWAPAHHVVLMNKGNPGDAAVIELGIDQSNVWSSPIAKLNCTLRV